MRNRDVADEFACGRTASGNNTISICNGGIWAFYSYSTMMAHRDDNGKMEVNTKRYSVTTSKHMHYLKDALRAHGWTPTGKVDELGWEIWE